MNALSMKQGLSLNTILMALAVFAIVSLLTADSDDRAHVFRSDAAQRSALIARR